jgi:DNA-binding NarL/FixJ family response regulator
MEKIKLMIVDDQYDFFTFGLEERLKKNPIPNVKYIGMAVSGEEALRKIEELKKKGEEPDLILLDYWMPRGMTGAQTAKEIKNKYPNIRIIITTAQFTARNPDSKIVKESIKSGAMGFFPKEFVNFKDLPEAIKTVMSGKIYYGDNSVIEAIIAENENENLTVPESQVLTPSEIEVIRLLATGIRSREDIGKELGIAIRTVSNHITNAIKKTGTHNQVELIEWARRNGLI